MRRACLVASVSLALATTGCLRWLDPDYVCDDECFIGESGCVDDFTSHACVLEPLFGCMIWVTDQDCGARNAVCVEGDCTCSWGFVSCPPGDQCIDPYSDPVNCGACGVVCPAGGTCQGGQCQAPTS